MNTQVTSGGVEVGRSQPWEQPERLLQLLHAIVDYAYSFQVEDTAVVTTTHGYRCAEVTGYDQSELEASPSLFLHRVVHKADRPAVLEMLNRSLEEHTPKSLEHRIVRKSGAVRWVLNTVVPQANFLGNAAGGDGVIRDITDRKHARQLLELQLAAANELSNSPSIPEGIRRMLSSAAPIFQEMLWDVVALWTVDERAEVLRCAETWCSPEAAKDFRAFARRASYRPGEGLPGRVWAGSAAPGGTVSENLPQSPASIPSGLREICGFPVSDQRGVVGVLEFLSRSAQEPGADVIKGLNAFSMQLGQFLVRRRAEDALVSEGNLLRTMIDALPVYVYVKDRESRFVLNNQAHAQVLGASNPQEVLGKTDLDYFPRELALGYRRDEEMVIVSGKPLIDREERVVPATGTQRWCLTSKVPLRDARGRIFGIVGVTRDITDRKEAEVTLRNAYNELEHSQEALRKTLMDLESSNSELRSAQLQLINAARLESLGALAAAVAHDVKNPLQTILMGVEYLERNLRADNPQVPEVVQDMRDAVIRSKAMVGDLVDLSAPSSLQMVDEDLNAVLERSLRLIHFDLTQAQINVTASLDRDLPLLKLDRSKIEQVFLNLFSNAVQAMPAGGTLTVSTKRTQLKDLPCWHEPEFAGLNPAEQAVIAEVQDTGSGIPPENLDKVCNTWFTTKSPGKGTGLGLSIVKNIIKMHRGFVHIRNTEPHGVIVTLILRGA